WLPSEQQVMVLEEPTRGIDVGAKAEIQEAVAHLADTGVSVVFIASDLDEAVRLSDRIVVLRDQQKIGEITNGPAVTVQDVVELIAAESDEEGEEKVDAMEEKASAS